MKDRQEVLDKLKGVISTTPDPWYKQAKKRAAEKPWKRRSQAVALTVLRTLRAQKMSQKELAEQLGVSPQQVNKWVKGHENFTFETIAKLEAALGIELMEIKPPAKKTAPLEEIFKIDTNTLFKKSPGTALPKSAKTTSTEAKVIAMDSSGYMARNEDEKYG
ncbi:MAG: helix-turn-helix domain-containing protein [Cyclobacteriaceae bacterium]